MIVGEGRRVCHVHPDEFVSLRQLFSQYRNFFSQMLQFFFDRHAPILLGLAPFGKSPADLGSYAKD